jgi:hypothetical protein
MPAADLPPDSPASAPANPAGIPRFKRFIKIVLMAFLAAWLTLVFWNSAKPLPPGTHIVSQTSRLSESEVDFLPGLSQRQDSPAPDMSAIDHAEQLIVLDRSAVPASWHSTCWRESALGPISRSFW